MRVLIISDTHKKHKNLERILERTLPVDLLIHLGDACGFEEDIADMAGCPMEIVAGNNDYFSKLDREKELQIGKYKVLITHGHYYYVNAGTADLRKAGLARGFDIVMFGHTHYPVIEYDGGIVLLNPGSVSYPRQENKKPSYILMEIDRKGEAHFSIEYLE